MAVAPPGIRATLESADGHTAQIQFAVGSLTLNAEKKLLSAMQADLHPPERVRVVPSGLSVIGIATVDLMRNNQSTMALAALLVFAWLLVRLRSPRKASLVVLPVVTAVDLASLVVYLAGLQVSLLGALSSSIVIAIATDFSVLVLERYGEERQRGLAPDLAMAIASQRIGRAFTTSGLTTAGGFAVLALSNFPILSSFGLIVTLNVTRRRGAPPDRRPDERPGLAGRRTAPWPHRHPPTGRRRPLGRRVRRHQFGAQPDVATYVSLAAGANLGRGGPVVPPAKPALYKVGADDAVVPATDVAATYAAAPTPKRFVTIGSSGHLAFADICLIGSAHGGVTAIAQSLVITIPASLVRLAVDGCGGGRHAGRSGLSHRRPLRRRAAPLAVRDRSTPGRSRRRPDP